jgi:endonuclease/exonuclease/phosphatase family metal-dependent hydrolase
VRIGTFNILHGRSPEDGRVDVVRLADAVKRLDADVLGLQEVDRDQPRSLGADLTAIAAEAMGAVEHQFVAALAGTPGGSWMAATGDEEPGSASYGIALLSRYPVISWRVVRLSPMHATVPLWSTVTNRPFLARDEPRVAVAAVLDGPFGEFTVCTTHLSFIPGWSAVQLRRLVRSLTDTREPMVLIGDLNMQPAQAARLTGMRSIATAPTFPSRRPVRQIDHVLVRGGLTATGQAETPLLPLSDHRPLVVPCAPA